MGRPTVYTEEAAEEICERVANGETLAEVCRSEHLPPRRTVVQWDQDNREGFAARYARAKVSQLELIADQLLEISDDGSNDWMERHENGNTVWQLNGEHVQRSRLRSDNRKWLLAKLMPKKYGDKVTTSHANDPDNPLFANVATAELEERAIAGLMSQGIDRERALAIVRGRGGR